MKKYISRMKVSSRPDWFVLDQPLLTVSLIGLILGMSMLIPAYLYTSYREGVMENRGVTTSGTVVSADRACSDDERQLVEVSYKVGGEKHLLEANTAPNYPRTDTGLSVGTPARVRGGDSG